MAPQMVPGLKVISTSLFEQTNSICVEWVAKFSSSKYTELYSQVFSAGFCEQNKWRLFVQLPLGKLYLAKAKGSDNRLKVHVRSGAIDATGRLQQIVSLTKDFRDVVQGHGHPLVTFDLSKMKKMRGMFAVQVTIKFLEHSSVDKVGETQRKLMALHRKVDNLESDFLIISPDGRTLGVHKDILVKWPFFAALVETPMEESMLNMWTTEYDYETIRSVVIYMYTGHVELKQLTTAVDVLKASHQYQLNKLRELLTEYLIRNVDVPMVLEVLATAHLYGLSALKRACCATIVQQEQAKVKSKYRVLENFPNWKEFCKSDRQELINELRNDSLIAARKRLGN